jgi:hypothetical protein
VSRYWDDAEAIQRRIDRALIVAEYADADVTAIEYLRAQLR